MPTLEAQEIEALFAMFKGEPGTRKSTQALSFPKPIEFQSWDQKIFALGVPAMKWKINPKDIHYNFWNDWDKPRKHLEKLQVNCPFRTLVVDTITSAGDSINRQTKNAKFGTKNKSGGEKGLDIGGIAVNSIEDYKAEESALGDLVSILKDINQYHKVNIILIAHVIQKEMRSADGKTHMARIIVTAGKSIAQKIPGYCDEVYHFNIKSNLDASKEGSYALLTRHTGDDFARTSLPLDAEITFNDEPLYDKWIVPAIAEYNSYIREMREINKQQAVQSKSTTNQFIR